MFLINKSTTVAIINLLLIYLSNPKYVQGQTPPNYNPSTTNSLDVTFNGNLWIHPGQFLQPSEAYSMPSLSIKDVDTFEPYLAIMIDVEIVRSGLAYPLLHWYQQDLWIDTHDTTTKLQNLTETGAAYVGPQPNPGPPHTYIIFLFRQPLNYKFPQCFNDIFPLSIEARSGFDINLFMKVAGLKSLVAANWFTSQNPEGRPTTTSLKTPSCAKATWNVNAVIDQFHADL